jgi:hypothetical protein
METCYAELGKAIAAAEWDDSGVGYSANGIEQIRQAVEVRTDAIVGRPVGDGGS